MKYVLDFTPKAIEGIRKHQKSGDKQTIKKLDKLLSELREHPTSGEGKPKCFKYYGKKHWVRKITDKHRLLYRIEDNIITVLVLQTYGHYDDK